MNVFLVLALAYLGIAVAVGTRLSWYLWRHTDQFDWQYRRLDLVVTTLVATLLWPLLLIKPSNFADPRGLFHRDFDVASVMASRTREKANFRRNPPLCARRLRYRATGDAFEETFGVFTFDIGDIHHRLMDQLEKHPHLREDDEGEMLHWLQSCEVSDDAEWTDFPSLWSRFDVTADQLAREGKGQVFCRKCDAAIPDSRLVTKDDKGKPGWNYNRLYCPAGHPLLCVRIVHIYLSRSNR